MLLTTFYIATLLASQTFAARRQSPPANPSTASALPDGPAIPVGADGKYTIVAEGIRAQFIPYGASITNLFINDTNGIERDVVLGYDNATYYPKDTSHPHLGGVPGRYANRIKNSTFKLDGTSYKVPANENNGADTLHGGPNGWDYVGLLIILLIDSELILKAQLSSGISDQNVDHLQNH